MPGEFEEGGVFFTHTVKDTDGANFGVGQTDDFSAGAAEFALQLDNAIRGSMEMLLEELLENVQGHGFQSDSYSRIAGSHRFLA
jgi:hypothetical protein